VAEVEVAAIFDPRRCDHLSVLLLETTVANCQLTLRMEVKIRIFTTFPSTHVKLVD
jgi:hypothetical protein